MKITNHHYLPEPLVHALSHDRYDPGDGDISATTLIGPAQIRILTEQHKDDITVDAVDRLWSMLGSAVHYVIENATIDMKEQGVWDDSTHIAEKRYYAEFGGKRISAQIDLKEGRNLYDFKVTSVWAIKDAIYKGGKSEWEAQLNIQRYLMAQNGDEVDKLFIMAIARDWNRMGSLNDDQYPPRGCLIEIPVWGYPKTEAYMQERLNAHFGKHTPMCTPEEMWEQPPKFALMKKGNKRALRLGDSREFLMDFAQSKGLVEMQNNLELDEQTPVLTKDHYIDERPGKRNRCEGYCDVAPFCRQYKEWVAGKE